MISPYLKLPRSEIRTNILLSLLRENKTLAELKAEVAIRDTTILHALKDLEALKLTVKSDRAYSLTNIGIIEALILEDFSSAADVLESFRDFWLLHDIKVIPPHFLRRIADLQDSILIRANSLKLTHVHENFLKILLNSKRIKGISPIFHPEFVQVFNQLLSKGATVELILTSQVFEKITTVEELEIIEKYLATEKLKIFLIDDLRLALTVTNNVLSLGLFNLNREYDYNIDLISSSREALRWGEDLFRHHQKNAKIILLDELNL